MTASLTNEEFFNELMSFSQYGPLTQVFVIEAVRFYSEKVSSTPEPAEHGNGMISAIVWHRIAVDVGKALEEQYASSAKH